MGIVGYEFGRSRSGDEVARTGACGLVFDHNGLVLCRCGPLERNAVFGRGYGASCGDGAVAQADVVEVYGCQSVAAARGAESDVAARSVVVFERAADVCPDVRERDEGLDGGECRCVVGVGHYADGQQRQQGIGRGPGFEMDGIDIVSQQGRHNGVGDEGGVGSADGESHCQLSGVAACYGVGGRYVDRYGPSGGTRVDGVSFECFANWDDKRSREGGHH